MKNLASGVGESKGYAFVNFNEHEDALCKLFFRDLDPL